MKHYDYVEWILYKNNLLNDKIYNKMEEHLFSCDECMGTFLSLIDEEDMEKAGDFIPEDFTDKVLESIKNIAPIKKSIKKKQNKNIPSDFFIYYAAVASVAIILTAGGFFGKVVDNVPNIMSSVATKESRLNANTIYNFTEKITNKTSMFINNFQFRIGKED